MKLGPGVMMVKTAGRKGGLKTLRKRGVKFFRKIGRLGGKARARRHR